MPLPRNLAGVRNDLLHFMQTVDAMTSRVLNAFIRTMPSADGQVLPVPKVWQLVNMGAVPVYVGDREYVVAFVDKQPASMADMESNQAATEEVVIRYLQQEGFIDEEYVYVGMQQFDLGKIPPDFMEEA